MNFKCTAIAAAFVLLFQTAVFAEELSAEKSINKIGAETNADKESGGIKVYVNSMQPLELERQPYYKEGVVYLPFEEICNALGDAVSYTNTKNSITLTKHGNSLKIYKVSTEGIWDMVNGVNIVKDAPNLPEIVQDGLYIPSYYLNFLGITASSKFFDGKGYILLTSNNKNVKAAQNVDYRFAADLLQRLPEQQNSVISPDSLETLLAMTANGTAGETKRQILDALYITDLDGYNQETAKKIQREKNSPFTSAVYHSANSIWINTDIYGEKAPIWKDAFLSLAEGQYSGIADGVSGKNLDKMNNWITENTNGLIKPQVNNKEFHVILVNAAAFHGSWLTPFLETATRKDVFHNADGSTSEILFMNMDLSISESNYFPYYEREGLQALTLRYGSIVPPCEDYAPYDMTFVLSDKLPDSAMLQEIFANQTLENVMIKLPKFKIQNDLAVIDILKDLGIKEAFQSAADLSPMFHDGAGYYIGNVSQNAEISIDEKGTEAAAASQVDIYRSITDKKLFIADRPFTYFIRNKETGEIIFEGVFVTGKGQEA